MITNSEANTQPIYEDLPPDSEKTNIKKVKDLKSIFEKGPEHHYYKPFQPL
jgi:hypothetical protein